MFVDCVSRGRAYTAARAEANAFGRRLAARFETVDALLAPTLRDVPPLYDRSKSKAGALRELASNTMPANLSGTPAVTVPVGDAAGLPVSAQVMTPRFAEDRALWLAGRLEGLAA
jgi:Asp-tRNA(Asn)/Glu-tRNA(Gln) amidotransferase A subunit family amidase